MKQRGIDEEQAYELLRKAAMRRQPADRRGGQSVVTAAELLEVSAPARTEIRIGFMPLLDCALLVVAHEVGMARQQGLALRLLRESSWANIRDRVAIGHFDAAHMLAPMVVAENVGARSPRHAAGGADGARHRRQCHHRVAPSVAGHARRRRRARGGARRSRRARWPRCCAAARRGRAAAAHAGHGVSRSPATTTNCVTGWSPAAWIRIATCGWSCCHRRCWWMHCAAARWMASASASRGTAWRWMPASA